MKIDTSAIKKYTGNIIINGVECNKDDIDNILSKLTGEVTIELCPVKYEPTQSKNMILVVHSWMTRLQGLYNFHVTRNNGKVVPFNKMYIEDIQDLGTIYYAKLYRNNTVWQGYIPKSGIKYMGLDNDK